MINHQKNTIVIIILASILSVKRYDELIEDLKKIEEKGFIKTHRSGNTGIGKTLEDLLEIEENNIAGPDGHQTELKSARKGSPSMLTLFTKSPMPNKINIKLLQKFGRISSNKRKKLHTTVNAVSRNTLYDKEGFKIIVHDARVEINHLNYNEMPTPYWEKQELEKAFSHKYSKNLLYVKADYQGKGTEEKFHFNEAWLMHGFSFDNFVKLLIDGKILVDIRIGQYPDGRPHDHGTGFRVLPDNLDVCFTNREKVL